MDEGLKENLKEILDNHFIQLFEQINTQLVGGEITQLKLITSEGFDTFERGWRLGLATAMRYSQIASPKNMFTAASSHLFDGLVSAIEEWEEKKREVGGSGN
jgi:hypothetical protein